MKTKRHELIDADRTCREKPSSASRVGPLLLSNTHSTPAQARVILLYLTSRPQSGPPLPLSLTFRQKRLLFFHFCRLSQLNDPPSLRTRGGEEVTLSPGVTAALRRGIYCVFLFKSHFQEVWILASLIKKLLHMENKKHCGEPNSCIKGLSKYCEPP